MILAVFILLSISNTIAESNEAKTASVTSLSDPTIDSIKGKRLLRVSKTTNIDSTDADGTRLDSDGNEDRDLFSSLKSQVSRWAKMTY